MDADCSALAGDGVTPAVRRTAITSTNKDAVFLIFMIIAPFLLNQNNTDRVILFLLFSAFGSNCYRWRRLAIRTAAAARIGGIRKIQFIV
jgi:hypothetical protein